MNTIMNTTRLHKWIIVLVLALGLAVTSTSSAFMEDAVGRWLLDDNESNSTVLDGSCDVNGHHGTFYDENGPNNTEGHHINGKLGGALHFDAYDEDHIRVPSHSDFEFDEYDAFSIAFWIRTNEGVGNVVAKINYYWQGYFVTILGDGTVFFRISEDEHWYFIVGEGTTDVADDEWHLVTCTYDGSESENGILVYVDGSEDDTYVWGFLYEEYSAANSEPLCFAARYYESYGSSYHFGGDLDDVSIYSKELSASEVNELWNDGDGLSYPSCWNCLSQCHADVDCDGDVDTDDWPPFRDGFPSSYPSQTYIDNVCADYDRDGDIDTDDWPEFRDNFLQSVPADCDCGGTWPPE